MLEWYKRLLELRKRYVTRGERRADAQYSDGVLSMQVPAREPMLIVQAALVPGSPLPGIETGWQEQLRSNEDGYRLSVLTKI
jgi:hypothetical protein